MKVAIQEQSGSYWRRWLHELEAAGATASLVDLRTAGEFQSAIDSDGVMWHIDMHPSVQYAANSILNTLEFAAEKAVFPNIASRWHSDNKLSQYCLFQKLGINTPATHVFWEEEQALDWLSTNQAYLIVAKLKRGASSSCVFILRNEKDALSYIRRMFSVNGISKGVGTGSKSGYRVYRDLSRKLVLKLPRPILQRFLMKRHSFRDVWPNERGFMYLQEYLPGNTIETRETVIWDRTFAFIRYNREDDFRASGSGKIFYDMESISAEVVSLALETSKSNGFQSMAYDFLFDKNGDPSLAGINYAYQSKAVYDCPGYWDSSLKWHEGHNYPEAAHVEEFLKHIESRRA